MQVASAALCPEMLGGSCTGPGFVGVGVGDKFGGADVAFVAPGAVIASGATVLTGAGNVAGAVGAAVAVDVGAI